MTHVIDMTHIAQEIGLSERYFITREKGDAAYGRLHLALESAPEGEALTLAFPSGQLIDASFADECLIRLQTELIDGKFGNRGLMLQDVSPDSVHNIESAIKLQDLKMAFLIIDASGHWKTSGRLEPSLIETLGLIARAGRLTAPELAARRKLAINSASNRLKRLYDLRLVRREHEISPNGLQYIYSLWTTAQT